MKKEGSAISALRALSTASTVANPVAARSQMGFSLGWHVILACFGVGLPALVVFAEWREIRTGDPVYQLLARRWASARACEDHERRAADLHRAPATREVIGQAEGVLMERERVTAGNAFDVLRRSSQHLNLKLRDVAQALVDTGQMPKAASEPQVTRLRTAPPSASQHL